MTIYASQVPSPDPRATLVVCTYCEGRQVDPLIADHEAAISDLVEVARDSEGSLTASPTVLAPCPACDGEGMREVPATLPRVDSDVY